MPSIIIGLVAISLGLWGLSAWWWSMVEFLRGVAPLALVLFGFIALGAGVTRLREAPTPSAPGSDHDADELRDPSPPSKPV
ncbi:MAG: hypothetical protein HQL64_16365, partial [Magnetococcales bacterium]|nr:hypothetical protein [Magnetococcales bacterium]